MLLCLLGVVTAARADTGQLRFVGVVRDGIDGVAGLHGPLALAISPGGEHVYAAGALDNAVAAFRADPASGRLSFVDAYSNGVNGVQGLVGVTGPRPIALSPDGRHVYVASAADSTLAVFRRDPAAGTLAFVEAQVDGVGGVTGLSGAWAAAVSPDGRHVYTAAFAARAVAVFERDPATGALHFVEAQTNGVAGIVGLDDP